MRGVKLIGRGLVSSGALAICLCLASPSMGQYQVSQPGDAPPNNNAKADLNAVNSPNRPPGVELYGNNNREKPVRYPPQTEYLPSEILFATQRSGATPSEIRTQSDRIGPLSPNGQADYIPPLSPLQRATGMTPPVLFGPAWQTQPPITTGPAGPTQPLNNATLPNANPAVPSGSQPQATPLDVTPGPVNPQQPIVRQPIIRQPLGPVTPVNTTVNRPIHYTRPAATQPATQPVTTQPSLGNTVR